MNSTIKKVLVIASLTSLTIIAQNNAPIVSNVTFEQHTDNSFLVDIYYDVSDADGDTLTIKMKVSNDAGVTFNFSANSLSGDIGDNILSGTNKHIVWDFGTDHPNYKSDQIQIKIIANDNVIEEVCPATVEYSGKTYNTVLIGNQCWLKENLDVGKRINGSSNQTDNNIIEKYCYANIEANCTTYGGLYQWDEAMQYNPSDGDYVGTTKGICPDGWHIPTHHEIKALNETVGGNSNVLKAIGEGAGDGAGTNTSGFSALIAGYRWDSIHFYGLDERTFFWSSKEEGNITNVDAMMLYYNNNDFYIMSLPKTAGLSVRCIKNIGSTPNNNPPNQPTNPTPENNAVNINTTTTLSWVCNDPDGDNLAYDIYFGTNNPPPLIITNQSKTNFELDSLEISTTYYWKIVAKDGNGGETIGTIWSFTTKNSTVLTGKPCPGIPTVTYSGQTYNTVQIGTQCWLKENLNVGVRIDADSNMSNNNTIEKYCYNNDISNCGLYGGLYQWEEAMQYVTTERTQGICPNGWHIPSKAEYETLTEVVGNRISSNIFSGGNALKAIGQGAGDGNGTNISGFSALLSGRRYGNGNFDGLNSYTYLWSSTSISGYAHRIVLIHDTDDVFFNHDYENYGFSVRCLKN